VISRNKLVELLWAENVLARRYFYPGVHRMEPYKSYFPNAGVMLPETEKLCGRVLILPTGQSISPGDVSAVCNLIRFAVSHGKKITERTNHPDKKAHVNLAR